MKKLISILMICSVVLIGCQENDQRGNRQSRENMDELEKVTFMLDWTPNTNHTGIYVALEQEIFKNNGLDVEIITPVDAGSIDMVAVDKADFGISYQEQVTYSRTAKNPLTVKAIAAIIQHNTSGFAAPVSKGIKTPKDFEGKIYGGYGTPIEESFLRALMEKENADFSKLDILNIGQSDFFSATKEDVDFSWIFYGWDGIAAGLKDISIDFIKLQDVDERLDFYTPVVIASEDKIATNPELIQKFLLALEKGYQYAINNPEEAAKILIKHNPGIDLELAIESQKYLSEEYISDAPKWGHMKQEIWDEFGFWMYENQLIDKKLEGKEAFTNAFLP
jgi:ABC-type nitrate/sulfonate/bicarbonate transport system substrate-binding protein